VANDHLTLIGGGGHALVVASTAQALGVILDGFIDDSKETLVARLMSLTHLGTIAEHLPIHAAKILCIGSLATRRRILASSTSWHAAATVIHPTAWVAPSAIIGPGTFIGPNAVINAFARIGAHAMINSAAVVEHECTIGANTHIAPGAILAGNVSVGPHTLVGLGARILPGRTIGAEATVGAGAVVIADVPDRATVIGVPARLQS
jgi:sugar O-acyltransferase (sialic acid O-acetyltransferase NeuD family)